MNVDGTRWVGAHAGIRLISPDDVRDVLSLALRHNPRRAHLLVSHLLGKHIPAEPRKVHAAGLGLGALVRQTVHSQSVASHSVGNPPPLVLGFAETATGLGHVVAAALDAPCLHSTRRSVRGVRPYGGFEEEHSHATSHLLLPEDPALFADDRALILVDDELTTGRTALNTIRALHQVTPHPAYVLAALVDSRDEVSRKEFAVAADHLGVSVAVTASYRAAIELPEDVATIAEALRAAAGADGRPGERHGVSVAAPSRRGDISEPVRIWSRSARDGGRHGHGTHDRLSASLEAGRVATRLAEQVTGDRVLVLGTEELMYAPLLIALFLGDLLGDAAQLRFSSTTRSPVLVVDDPGYPIRTALRFGAHDVADGQRGHRFAYNVAPAKGSEPFTDIVVVVDEVGDSPALWAAGGLLDQLAGVAARIHPVILPSYRPEVS